MVSRQQHDELSRLHEQGWSAQRMSWRTGLPLPEVEAVLEQQREARAVELVRRERARVMAHAGVAVQDVAARLGVSVSVVQQDLASFKSEQDARRAS